MNKVLFSSIVVFLLWSCNDSKNNKKQHDIIVDTTNAVLTERMSSLFWGMDDNRMPNTNNAIEAAFYYLNKSLYRNAFETLKNNYELDTIYTGGFYGFKGTGSYEPNKYKTYTFYRLNDYSENITGNELSSQLLRSLVDSVESLFILQEVEYSCLNQKNTIKIEDAEKLIQKLIDLKRKKPGSKRLDYLLAYQYLIVNDTTNALKIYDKLISKDYYALPVLRNVIRFLSSTNSGLVNKYMLLLDNKFPLECNLTRIKFSLKTIREDSLLTKCRKCYQSSFQIDSMHARLLLAKYYMENKKVDKVESLVNDYEKNIDDEPYNDERLYVKGLYYDLKMQVWFLQGKYRKMCNFVQSKMQSNPVITIDNNDELKFYIQKLYLEHFASDTDGFSSFFEKNFYNCYTK